MEIGKNLDLKSIINLRLVSKKICTVAKLAQVHIALRKFDQLLHDSATDLRRFANAIENSEESKLVTINTIQKHEKRVTLFADKIADLDTRSGQKVKLEAQELSTLVSGLVLACHWYNIS